MIEVARAAAQFVLPSDCLACRERPVERFLAGGVCDRCWRALPPRESERCACCDETLPGAAAPALCGRCLLDLPAFASLRGAAPYAGTAREILLAFKFRGADYLGARLADVMRDRLPPPRRGRNRLRADDGAVPPRPGVQPGRGPRARAVAAAEDPFRAAPARQAPGDGGAEPPSARRAQRERAPRLRDRRTPGRARSPRRRRRDFGRDRRECARRLAEAGARRVDVWCFARASRADAPETA